MKTSKILSVALVVAFATLCVIVQAAGFNPASLVTPELAMGISMAGAAGMINYVQDGDTLTLTPAADVASGVGYLFGQALFGVAQGNVTSGSPGEFMTEGVVTIGKTSALAIAVGDRVYWDATNKVVNKTALAQQCVGVCVVAAGNPSSTVTIKLSQLLPVAT